MTGQSIDLRSKSQQVVGEGSVKYYGHGNTPCGQDDYINMHGHFEFRGREDSRVEEKNGNLHKGKTDHKGETLNPQSLESPLVAIRIGDHVHQNSPSGK